MQVVIDIPEGEYQHIKNVWRKRRGSVPWSYIAFGTPIPKGHGRLIDISKLDNDRIESDNPIIHLTLNGEDIEAVSLDYLDSLPTIIPEDGEIENV